MNACDRIVSRLRRLVADAARDGVSIIADAGSNGRIRVAWADESKAADDLRDVGVSVRVHGACGGGITSRIGPNGES